MIIIFLEFLFKIFNEKVLNNVSIVLPDLETIIKRSFEKSSFFLIS